jgi:hypothetical protein
MKRNFFKQLESVDEIIPDAVLDAFPEHKKKLQRIQKLSEDVDEFLSRHMRQDFQAYSEPSVKKKILRVFVHHKFVPATVLEKGHFVVFVEGSVLDKDLVDVFSFGSFFEKIRFQLDRRFCKEDLVEWTTSALPEGTYANTFTVKIYTEKANNMKIFLHRNNDVRQRYELSPQLGTLLPYIQLDPTQEDVLTAIWQYVATNNLFVDSNQKEKEIQCDEYLRPITGRDTITFAGLKQKVLDNMAPCKPIQVDYSIASARSTGSTTRFTPAEFAKEGGKAFDLEVDVLDPIHEKVLQKINGIVKKASDMAPNLGSIESKCLYLAQSLTVDFREMVNCQALSEDPFGVVYGRKEEKNTAEVSATSSDDGVRDTRIQEANEVDESEVKSVGLVPRAVQQQWAHVDSVEAMCTEKQPSLYTSYPSFRAGYSSAIAPESDTLSCEELVWATDVQALLATRYDQPIEPSLSDATTSEAESEASMNTNSSPSKDQLSSPKAAAPPAPIGEHIDSETKILSESIGESTTTVATDVMIKDEGLAATQAPSHEPKADEEIKMEKKEEGAAGSDQAATTVSTAMDMEASEVQSETKTIEEPVKKETDEQSKEAPTDLKVSEVASEIAKPADQAVPDQAVSEAIESGKVADDAGKPSEGAASAMDVEISETPLRVPAQEGSGTAAGSSSGAESKVEGKVEAESASVDQTNGAASVTGGEGSVPCAPSLGQATDPAVESVTAPTVTSEASQSKESKELTASIPPSTTPSVVVGTLASTSAAMKTESKPPAKTTDPLILAAIAKIKAEKMESQDTKPESQDKKLESQDAMTGPAFPTLDPTDIPFVHPPTFVSTIHSSRGFIDIGDAQLFTGSSQNITQETNYLTGGANEWIRSSLALTHPEKLKRLLREGSKSDPNSGTLASTKPLKKEQIMKKK